MQNLAFVKIRLFVLSTMQFLQISDVLQRCCDESFFRAHACLMSESIAILSLNRSPDCGKAHVFLNPESVIPSACADLAQALYFSEMKMGASILSAVTHE
jgi:hypothetical protein